MSEQIAASGLDSFALSDIAHVEMGQSPDSRYVVEDPFQGLAFLQGNAEFGSVYPEPKFGCLRPAKMCKANDVVISIRAPVGAINLADRDYCIGRGLAAIRGRGIKPSLLGEVVARQSLALRRVAQGTTFEAISKNDLLTLKLSLPPRTDWPQITQILNTLDTAIHETEAIIAKLKAVKQGLLHDLLTRGIDANGELRPPQAEAPHLYKPSPLGWIPTDWEASSAEAEFTIDAGITLGPHRIPRNRPTKYLRVANVHRGRLVLDDIAELEASNSETQGRALKPDDLLIVEGHASTSEIGRCAIADEFVRGMLFQNHLFRLRCKRLLSPKFALLWLNSELAQAYWRREAATSSGLNTINRAKLCRLQVAVPPRDEQVNIAAREASVATRIDVESRLLAKLSTQKSGLMDDLLTGRVRVTPLLAADHEGST